MCKKSLGRERHMPKWGSRNRICLKLFFVICSTKPRMSRGDCLCPLASVKGKTRHLMTLAKEGKAAFIQDWLDRYTTTAVGFFSGLERWIQHQTQPGQVGIYNQGIGWRVVKRKQQGYKNQIFGITFRKQI